MSRGFEDLPCLSCGETETAHVRLSDGAVTCTSCDVELTLEEINDRVSRWSAVSRWLSTMPGDDEEIEDAEALPIRPRA